LAVADHQLGMVVDSYFAKLTVGTLEAFEQLSLTMAGVICSGFSSGTLYVSSLFLLFAEVMVKSIFPNLLVGS
jgi:hypothetical protein